MEPDASPAVQAHAPLAPFTTLGVGGPARQLVEAATEADVVAQVSRADRDGEPLLVLGGGSNLVIADDGFPGTALRVATRGIEVHGDGRITVAAGEDWDRVVDWSVTHGLAGLECLSGIPGSAGATPIQNVGAYGQDVSQTIVSVRVYDRARHQVDEVAAADCGFGYRDSAFKRSAAAGGPTGRQVVLAVTFALEPTPLSAPVRYAELARALGVSEGDRAPLRDVRAAVLALRRGKGMVVDEADVDSRSAGSFFTNPVLDTGEFAALERAAAATCGPGVRIPQFPAGPEQVKVSAAWLIERAGFGKGYQPAAGRARVSSKHTLALVNPGGASAADVLGLAREIRDGVRKAFGVELAAEPVCVGLNL